MGDADAKAQKRAPPAGAPKDLVEFVDCTGATVTIKAGKIGWAGKLDLGIIEIEPEISFAPGLKDGITLTVGGAMLSITLPGWITDGQLGFDTSRLPETVADFVGQWVGDINAWLKANGKQFGKATLDTRILRGRAPVSGPCPVNRLVRSIGRVPTTRLDVVV
jgi:hypothetical protein